MMIEIKDDDVLSFRAQYADVMAVLAMTMGQHDGTEFFLKFANQTNHSN
jgi:hypothetical protein